MTEYQTPTAAFRALCAELDIIAGGSDLTDLLTHSSDAEDLGYAMREPGSSAVERRHRDIAEELLATDGADATKLRAQLEREAAALATFETVGGAR